MTSTSTTSVKQLIEAVNQADSAIKLLETVQNLAQTKSPEAIPTLIEVLGFNNPGAAVAATEGLIGIGEPVIEPLLKSLDEYNYGARAWALRVFAEIGDVRALDLILQAATSDFSLSVRRAATKGLGNLQWHQLAPTEVIDTQKKVFDALCLIAQDGEWVVRYSCIVALENLGQKLAEFNHLNLREPIISQLEQIIASDTEIAVCTRGKLALSRI
jgi:phycocyanobilin lyase beta subunit